MYIYQKFNEALIDVGKDPRPDDWVFPKACLVMMEKINDNKLPKGPSSGTGSKEDIHPHK